MSHWKLVKLDFDRNPVHFGELGIGMEESSERAYSDTLFSAWMSSYARLFGKTAVEELFKQFNDQPEQPPFRLSSTFIYHEDTYYLPRPIVRPKGYPEHDLKFTKEYKKLNYLPLKIWRRWYQADGFTPKDRKELEGRGANKEIIGELQKAKVFDYGEAYKSQCIPKVSLDRTTRASNFYHVGFVKFQEKAGLYFLVYFPKDDSLLKRLESALYLLGEDGMGGERSSGAGRFTPTWHDLDEKWKSVVNFKSANHFHSLISLLWEHPFPSKYLEGASYAIQERSGWIASPLSGQQARRQAVRMFTEGSVFSKPIGGRLANVTPGNFKAHQIYRSGISLSLPIYRPPNNP